MLRTRDQQLACRNAQLVATRIKFKVLCKRMSRASQARAKSAAAKPAAKIGISGIPGEFRGKAVGMPPLKARYSARGGILLACRRSMSNVSGRGMGFVLMRDLHHGTVCNWEIKCRAATIASARAFFRSMSIDLMCHAETDQAGWKFAVHQ